MNHKNQHNYFALNHDKVCSYISKSSCREYYREIILNNLALKGVDFEQLNVLELGCGTGTWADLFPSVKSYVGVDLSDKMIHVAKQKYSQPNQSFHCMPVEEYLQGHANTYDIILSSSFLHHLFDIDATLQLVGEALKSGGVYLAIHEPLQGNLRLNRFRNSAVAIDRSLSALIGYDCDVESASFLKRGFRTFSGFIPFYPKLKNLILKKRVELDSKSENKEIDFVDYKLSKGQRFHPSTFLNKKYPNLSVNFDIYTYYANPWLGHFFGDSYNYFLMQFKKY